MKAKPLTKEQEQIIKDNYLLPINTLARMIGKHQQVISKYLDESGLRKPKEIKMTDERGFFNIEGHDNWIF